MSDAEREPWPEDGPAGGAGGAATSPAPAELAAAPEPTAEFAAAVPAGTGAVAGVFRGFEPEGALGASALPVLVRALAAAESALPVGGRLAAAVRVRKLLSSGPLPGPLHLARAGVHPATIRPEAGLQAAAVAHLAESSGAERNPPIDELIQAGGLAPLVGLLGAEDDELQVPHPPCLTTPPPVAGRRSCAPAPFSWRPGPDVARAAAQLESAWAITNVCSGDEGHVAAAIDAGAVPPLVQLLGAAREDVREQAAWGLGNIAGDSPDCRDTVLRGGVLPPLLAQLTDAARPSLLRTCARVLSNLCRGKPPPAFDQVSTALPCLKQLLGSADAEVLADGCWALSYLSGADEQAVVDAGVLPRVVELLR
jgi:hypothetical protein